MIALLSWRQQSARYRTLPALCVFVFRKRAFVVLVALLQKGETANLGVFAVLEALFGLE